jgi:hypothetical protein
MSARAGRWATAAFLIAAPAARAQTVEITPVIGYRFGGGFAADSGVEGDNPSRDLSVKEAGAWGIHLGIRVAADGEIEALYARQPTELRTDGLFTGEPLFDLTLETWQLGGLYLLGDEGARLRPFVGAGFGVTRLLPGPSGLQEETRFSASFAAGLKAALARHLALRLEARGFFTVLEGDGDPFCRTGSGTCAVRVTGSDISQAEIRAGLALRF